ncbi:MAG: queuosine precursor transporter [Holosporales bacterium]|nr:queuosine precursor transporter [Holosporales bacterium]
MYNGLAICMANIQVLHITQYTTFPTPIPLGTILFTTVFISNSKITKQYGEASARKGVYLSLFVYVFFSLSMILSMMHKPFVSDSSFSQQAFLSYKAMVTLFSPSVRIFLAGIISFFVSQLCNVIFLGKTGLSSNDSKLKRRTSLFATEHRRHFTEFLAVFSSGLIDSIVFTHLAFYWLAPTPLPTAVIWKGYIMSSTIIRFTALAIYSLFFKKIGL